MTWPLFDFVPAFLQRQAFHDLTPLEAANAQPAPTSTVAGSVIPSAAAQEPARYQPHLHGTLADFHRSDDFARFQIELTAHLSALTRVAHQHLSPRTAESLSHDLDEFKDHVLSLDDSGQHRFWGFGAEQYFNHGQNLLALFAQRVADDRMPLQDRLNALQETVPRLTVCLQGALQALEQACIDLDRSRTGFIATVDRAFDQLLNQCIVQSVEAVNRTLLAVAPASQVHLVAGLQQTIYPAMSRPPPPLDRMAVIPSSADHAYTLREVRSKLVPGRLCEFLADAYLQRWQQGLTEALGLSHSPPPPWDWTDEMEAAAQAAEAALEPEFGQMPRHAVLSLNEDAAGRLCAWPLQDPSILGRHLLFECRRLGIVSTDREPQPVSLQRIPHPLLPGRDTTLMVMHQDSVLAWAEEAGTPRALRITDLAPWSDGFWARGLPRRAAAAALLSALRCADPHELTQLTSHMLLDEERHYQMLCSRLDDNALQSMLRHSDIQVSDRRCIWLLNTLVSQQRLALLRPEEVHTWTPLVPTRITETLMRLALQHNSAALVEAVGELIRRGAEFHHDTVEGFRWRKRCLMPTTRDPGEITPMAEAIHGDRGEALRSYIVILTDLRLDPVSPASRLALVNPNVLSRGEMVELLNSSLYLAIVNDSPAALEGLLSGMLTAWQRGAMSRAEIEDVLNLRSSTQVPFRLMTIAARHGPQPLGLIQEAIEHLQGHSSGPPEIIVQQPNDGADSPGLHRSPTPDTPPPPTMP